jgi:hypothetical protein
MHSIKVFKISNFNEAWCLQMTLDNILFHKIAMILKPFLPHLILSLWVNHTHYNGIYYNSKLKTLVFLSCM